MKHIYQSLVNIFENYILVPMQIAHVFPVPTNQCILYKPQNMFVVTTNKWMSFMFTIRIPHCISQINLFHKFQMYATQSVVVFTYKFASSLVQTWSHKKCDIMGVRTTHENTER